MNTVIAGAASGFLMASLFICAGEIMLFFLVKDPSPGLVPVFERFPPAKLALYIVAMAYPTWGGIGTVLAVLYTISAQQLPGTGLGSPNLAFTLAVVLATVALAVPLAVALRPVRRGLLALAITAMGIFGWFLPYFAT